MSDPANQHDVRVTDAPDRGRFEVRLDGEAAGIAQYWRRSEVIAFTHTEVDPRFEHHGLGGRLIGAALSQARTEGLSVLPFCPFVRTYIEDDGAEFIDLVPTELRRYFNLENGS